MNLFIKNFVFFVLFLSFLSIFPTTTKATDYFVSTAGNDSADGSQNNPFKTIQKAATIASEGDIVTVHSGQYSERVTITRSGSSGKQIIFKALGTVYTKGFNVLASYITVQGFNATSDSTNWRDGWGIFVNGSYNTIVNNFVYYSKGGGIDIFHPPTQSTPTSNNVIKDNRVFRNYLRNIELEGTNSTVEGNEIWATLNPGVDPPGSISGDLGDSDGIHFHGSGHIIRFNHVHNISYSDPQISTGHMDCFQTFKDTYHEAATNILIERNTCELETYNDCCIAHSFMLASADNLIIKNNILHTVGGVNQGSTGTNSNVFIYNNTFVSKKDIVSNMPATGINTNGSTNYTVKNNILVNFKNPVIYFNGFDANTLGHVYSNNLIYNTSSNWCPNGTCIYADPHFISLTDFHLQANSPAINAGANLSSVINDFDGITRPQGSNYDIGAYEYSGNIVLPSPTPTKLPTPLPTHTPTPAFLCPPDGITGSGTASINVTLSQTGNYKPWVNLKAQGDSANSLWLNIDNLFCAKVGDLNGMPTNTWLWVDYENGNTQDKIPSILLTAGNHTIKLTGNIQEPGVAVDRLLLTLDSSCIPTGNGDACIGIYSSPTSQPTTYPTLLPTSINIPTPIPTQGNSDTTPPNIVISSPKSGTTLSKNQVLKVSGTISDTSGIAWIKLYLDSRLLKTCQNSTSCSTSVRASAITKGTHSVTVIAQDKALIPNAGSKTIYFYK